MNCKHIKAPSCWQSSCLAVSAVQPLSCLSGVFIGLPFQPLDMLMAGGSAEPQQPPPTRP